MTGPVVIGPLQLALATVFVVFVGFISVRLSLGLEKDLLWGTIRTYVQLFAIGYFLTWIFDINHPAVVIAWLFVMLFFATRIALKRIPDDSWLTRWSTFFSLFITTLVVTFTVTGVIVGVEPWFRPQYVLPLAGMILGNSMNGIALALERTFADLDAHVDEVRTLVSLGATPWEASQRRIRAALTAGIMPTINALSAVGIVSLPGMMSGQILAGADPLVATGYQIVVMLMVSAASAMGAVLAVLLTYKRRFDRSGIYLEEGFRG